MNKALRSIRSHAYAIAVASKGNPVLAIMTVMGYWGMFIFVEVGIERLIWGERFEHWLDPIFNVCFIGFAGLVVWECAVFQTVKAEGDGDEY